MRPVWEEMYRAARSVQNERRISDYVEAGCVAAAVLSAGGTIYTGVCIDTCSTLGICAERNAIFNMITNGEHEIEKVLAVTQGTLSSETVRLTADLHLSLQAQFPQSRPQLCSRFLAVASLPVCPHLQ